MQRGRPLSAATTGRLKRCRNEGTGDSVMRTSLSLPWQALLAIGLMTTPSSLARHQNDVAPARAECQDPKGPPGDWVKKVTAAREKGLDWLTKNHAANGSWGKDHSIAVT